MSDIPDAPRPNRRGRAPLRRPRPPIPEEFMEARAMESPPFYAHDDDIDGPIHVLAPIPLEVPRPPLDVVDLTNEDDDLPPPREPSPPPPFFRHFMAQMLIGGLFEDVIRRPPRNVDKRDTSSLMDHYGGGYWKRTRTEREKQEKPAETASSTSTKGSANRKYRGRRGAAHTAEAATTSESNTQMPTENANPAPQGDMPAIEATEGDNAASSIFKDFKCVVCLDTVKDPTSTFCGHVFCEECILASIQSSQRCPTCRCKLSAQEVHPLFV